MGIQGLLPFLKKASRPATLQEFRGQTAAIDAYCWLHKGAFSCAEKLVRGEPTDGYVIYMMRQISQLLNYDIKPILVFDGCHLPSKAVTESKRRETRERNRKKAKELLREGKIREAKECFQRCVDITSEMAAEVIAACRARNIDIIVAPYEADSQLAFLNLSGIAQLVITEDSDLVLFGCKHILFKMDYHGNGILVDHEKLHLAMGVPRDKFMFDKFRNMCILSGCDYLPSLPGIGLAKSCKFFNVTSNPDIHNVLCKIPAYLKMPQLEVTIEYRDGFMKARNTFLYQLVFDPLERRLRPLCDYPDGMGPDDYPYAGRFVGHDRALQIALGNVNVQTGDVVDSFDPEHYKRPEMKSSSWDKKGDICTNHPSIWKQDYTPKKPPPAVPSLAASNRETTKGKEVVVPTVAVKRKRVADVEPATPDLTEGELQSMYTVSEKKIKAEETPKAEDSGEDCRNAIEELVDAMDDNDDNFTTEASDTLLLNAMEEGAKTEPVTSPSETRKSKNPFAKVQSPRKKNTLPANQFSALKNFNKIRKTFVDPDTVIHSRYFGSPLPSEPARPSGSIEDLTSAQAESDCADAESHKETAFKSPEEKDTEESDTLIDIIKAPLSPVQTNTLSARTEKTFKWGKLSDMFSYKNKNVKVESSPATKGSFKSVFSTKSAPSTPSVCKENNFVTLESVDIPEPESFSQKSSQSEVSAASDVGSVDNESFGLTPSSIPDSLESSQEEGNKQPVSQDNITSPVQNSPKVQLSQVNQRNLPKSRSVGLSRPRGKAQKRPDCKQLSLRDMFAFKKEVQKIQPTRPSL